MSKNNKVPYDSHGNGRQGKATNGARLKGKHQVNLRKRGFLHFQIGLILAMLLVYFGLEASFRMHKEYKLPQRPPEEELFIYEADIPVIHVERNVAKIQKVKSYKLKPVPNQTAKEVGEGVIEVPIDGADNGNINLDSIPFRDIGKEEPPTIIIDLVEEVPVFPGCEKVKEELRLSCFKEKVTKHVKRNFRYPEPAQDLRIQGTVHLTFKIGVGGSVTDVQLRGPSPLLENEAERIIRKLPKMVPGKQGGKPVKVPYSLPIKFQLN